MRCGCADDDDDEEQKIYHALLGPSSSHLLCFLIGEGVSPTSSPFAVDVDLLCRTSCQL